MTAHEKERECDHCGKIVKVPSDLLDDIAVFCSKKCAHKAWEQRNPDYKIKKHKYYLKKRDEYRRRNLDKAAIYSRVWYWKHKLPPMKKCENCGSTNKDDLVRHHPDYSKPYETVVLCHKCHSNVHNGEITLETC